MVHSSFKKGVMLTLGVLFLALALAVGCSSDEDEPAAAPAPASAEAPGKCSCGAELGNREHAAAYGLLQERFLSPEVEITIEGNTTDKSTFELLKGAFQLQTPHLLIRPVLNEDHQGGAEASICLSSVCMPPIQDVQGLRDQMSSIESNLQLSQDQSFEHFQL